MVHPTSFRTKTGAAHEAIRQAILAGELRPGDRVTVVGLAEQLGMSATPVREAVRSLQSAGLIHQKPHRGVEIVDLTLADSSDFYLVRATVESLATRLAVARLGDQGRADLDRAHRAVGAAMGDTEVFTRANIAWHFQLYEQCEMQHLIDYILRLWVGIAWRPLMELPGHMQRSFAEHEAIMSAVADHDAELAARLMGDHIGSGLDQLRAAGANQPGMGPE